MLPLVYMTKADGSVAEYSHQLAYKGIEDFITEIPGGRASFEKSLGKFCTELYRLQCAPNDRYYLDKTPRYYLIINELSRIFPTARFIFLTRSPIQIIASIISTFSMGTLRHMHFYQVDLRKGFHRIVEGIDALGHRAIRVRYEDLIDRSESELERIYSFLGLPWEQAAALNLGKDVLSGRLGDKWGSSQYQTIVADSKDKWQQVLRERTLNLFAKKIIDDIPDAVVSAFGYDKTHLLRMLDEQKTAWSVNGLKAHAHLMLSKLITFGYLNLYRQRVRQWTNNLTID